MTQRYASKTTVSSDRSKAEIEGILRRYGADQFMQGWEAGLGVVGFRINGFQVRMLLPLPNPEDFRHYERKSGYSTRQVERVPEAAQKAYEQAERQAWRALLLVIKAKLEAVEAGITSIEQEFLPNMVLPDNTTVGENMLPRLREIVASGHLPPMLPASHPIALGPPTQ